jgi:uncharacterized protein (TIGR02145 family)
MTVYQIIAVASLVLVIALWFKMDTLQATLKQLMNAKDAANLNQPNDSNDAANINQPSDSNQARESQAQKSEVIIGAQAWMAKNLDTTTFRNGDPIPQAASDIAWQIAGELKRPAYCYNGETYGKLYNWYAVNDPRGLAPEGWHIPTYAEWTQLSDYLGGKGVAGKKMKSTSGWNNKGNGTNESGFNGLPGGMRLPNGRFPNEGYEGYWWEASDNKSSDSLESCSSLGYGNDNFNGKTENKESGLSVRCIRD